MFKVTVAPSLAACALLASLVLGAATARAQVGDDVAEDMMALEDQLNQMVVTGTKTETRASETPAVITVITSDEIEVRGYASLAEALRTVPGFYDVYDLATHNIGIRGVNGGARASGNVLKLMIDGQEVSYRPSTGNFFGEELVPMAAVERVEVIRGPGSALYGANAFLGVVNVITKAPKSVEGWRLLASGGFVGDKPTGGGGLMLGLSGERGELLVAVQGQYADRSGLSAPDTSPTLATNPALRNATSQSDLSRPKSLLAKASVSDVAGGKVSLLASLQNLDAVGEFQDFGALAHDSRLARVNQTYRLAYDRQLGPASLRASATYFDSAPTSSEQLDIRQPTYVLIPDVAANGFEVAAEGHVSLFEALDVNLGCDYIQERQLLQTFSERVTVADVAGRAVGTVIPDAQAGQSKTFRTIGGFAQAMYRLPWNLIATAGARLETHNVYGTHFSPRLGLVWTNPERPYHLKLLYGSSYKAPSAEQLYTEPMQADDLRGAPSLTSQSAQTFELAGGVLLGKRAQVSANLFVTSIDGRIEFVKEGAFVTAKNSLDELYGGGELSGWWQIASMLEARLGLGVAALIDRSRRTTAVVSLVDVEQPLFPTVQAHLALDYRLPWLQARVSPELSYVGPRQASQANALAKRETYELPGFFYTALSVSLPARKLLGERTTSARLRVANLLNEQNPEPGFGGVDVPALGRTVLLSLTQEL